MAGSHDTSPRQQRCATRIEKTERKRNKMKEQNEEQIQRAVLVMKNNERRECYTVNKKKRIHEIGEVYKKHTREKESQE
jgi:hypothetical protein